MEAEVRAGRRWVPGWAWALAAVVVVLLGGLVGGRAVLDRLPRAPAVQTVDRSQPAVLHAVRDMAELRAASGQYSVVIDVERDVPFVPASLAGERVLFVAMGTVDAAVDLSALDADAVQVSPDGRSVTLTLPPAVLTAPRIDPDGSYVYDRQEGLADRVGDALFGGEDGGDQALYQQATDMLAEAAADSDLQDRAESNAADVMTGLLEGLGFEEVRVVTDAGITSPSSGPRSPS